MELMDESEVFVVFIVAAIVVIIYLIPTIIAFKRQHHYKFIIFGINIIGGMTGIGYLIAFIWAVWPSKTSVIDPLISSATSINAEDGKQIYGRWGEYKKSYETSSALETQQIDPQIKSKQNCPFCDEVILRGAIKCKNCGNTLDNKSTFSDKQTAPCPFCKELIKEGALKCRYCKSDL